MTDEGVEAVIRGYTREPGGLESGGDARRGVRQGGAPPS